MIVRLILSWLQRYDCTRGTHDVITAALVFASFVTISALAFAADVGLTVLAQTGSLGPFGFQISFIPRIFMLFLFASIGYECGYIKRSRESEPSDSNRSWAQIYNSAMLAQQQQSFTILPLTEKSVNE